MMNAFSASLKTLLAFAQTILTIAIVGIVATVLLWLGRQIAPEAALSELRNPEYAQGFITFLVTLFTIVFGAVMILTALVFSNN